MSRAWWESSGPARARPITAPKTASAPRISVNFRRFIAFPLLACACFCSWLCPTIGLSALEVHNRVGISNARRRNKVAPNSPAIAVPAHAPSVPGRWAGGATGTRVPLGNPGAGSTRPGRPGAGLPGNPVRAPWDPARVPWVALRHPRAAICVPLRCFGFPLPPLPGRERSHLEPLKAVAARRAIAGARRQRSQSGLLDLEPSVGSPSRRRPLPRETADGPIHVPSQAATRAVCHSAGGAGISGDARHSSCPQSASAP